MPRHSHTCGHSLEGLEVEEVVLEGRIYGDVAASLVGVGGVMWGGRGSPSHGGVGGLVWASWSGALGGRMRYARDGDVWTLPHNELVQDINL